MPTKYDERKLPEELKDEILAHVAPFMGPPPGANPEDFVFQMKEPELDWPKEVIRQSCSLGGVPGYAVTTYEARKDFALLHIHGGGFTGGSHITALRFMLDMKRIYGVDCYSVEYTLAPKVKAPVQVEQCIEYYKALLSLGYGKIILAGESAGGNLVLCVTLRLKELGLPLPAAVAASSPVVDFSGAVDRHNEDELARSSDSLSDSYLGGIDPQSPLVSPIYGDFNGCPPLLLQAGGGESLRHDSYYLGKLLESSDCDCTVSVWEGGGHAVGIDPGDEWHGKNCRGQIVDFFGEKAGLLRL